MKILKGICFTLILSFCMIDLNGQELKLATHGVSPRDVERDSVEQYFDRRYTGLENVGVGTKVYLKGFWIDSTLSTGSWMFLDKPAGSAAAFGLTKDLNPAAQLITFTPDVIGAYKIQFSDGNSADTIRISAGLYLGVTNTDINCVTCHNNAEWDYKYDKWSETGHAKALTKGLNGEKGSFFNNNCVQCHSVGYDDLAQNDGFDDWPFVFPDTLMPGMADSLAEMYPEAMARSNVQCEQCHGPGSEHFGNKFNISSVMSVENCNYCHNAGTHHVYGEQWLHSGNDATEFDGRGFEGGHGVGAFYEVMGARSSCAPCHSGSGFVQWIKEDRPVDEYGLPASVNFLPEPTRQTCATCHDPHDASKKHQLRFTDTQLGDGTSITMELYGTGATCMQCHRSRRNAVTYSVDVGNASSHYGPHHGPQADLLIGANAPDFGIEFPTSPHHVAAENTCVTCHMAGEAKVDENDEVILVGGHSWNMNDPEGKDFVEACAQCHGNIGASFKDKKYYEDGNADHDGDGTEEGVQDEVHGLLEQLALLLPPVNETTVSLSSDDSTLTPSIMKSAYVYFWIEEDRSYGIHNPAFTVSILKAAIVEVGGTITSVGNEKLPQVYSLSQNYPNPFNPSTLITFTLPQEGETTLKIYDIVGREVLTLLNEKKSAGIYKYQFNARGLASGVYIYRLISGDFIQAKKMILLK